MLHLSKVEGCRASQLNWNKSGQFKKEFWKRLRVGARVRKGLKGMGCRSSLPVWEEQRGRCLEADIIGEGEALVSSLSGSLWSTDLEQTQRSPCSSPKALELPFDPVCLSSPHPQMCRIVWKSAVATSFDCSSEVRNL